MEALVRWIHPENGIIYPNKFISLAEETGLIISIGQIVLYSACKQNKSLQESGLEPEWLELEITESIIMKIFDFSIEMLNKFRTMGIHVSLDDFGTGYSSLNYLKRLPIDTLKIDKSFLDNITKAIIELAHKMKLNVIAEGVEYIEQLNFLKIQKCNKVQGFLFSKPIPIEEFKQLLNRNEKFSTDNLYLKGDYTI